MQRIIRKCSYALPIVLLLALMVFFSGCVNLEVHQTISPSGTTNASVNLSEDMVPYYAVLNVSPDNYSIADAQMYAEICNESLFAQQGFININCNVSNTVFTFSADTPTVNLNSATFSVHPGLFYTEYWYTPSSTTQAEFNFTTDELQTIQSLRSLGVNATIVFEMPGEVYQTNGNIVNGAAQFDLFDILINGTTPYAKSRVLNAPLVGGLILVLVIIAGVSFWMNNQRPKQPKLRPPAKKDQQRL